MRNMTQASIKLKLKEDMGPALQKLRNGVTNDMAELNYQAKISGFSDPHLLWLKTIKTVI